MIGTKIIQRKKHQKWVFLFLVACFLFSIDVSAQYYPPLVPELTAQTILADELPALEDAMNNLPPNSVAFQVAERKFLLYSHTWEGVVGGRDVAEALTDAYGEYAHDANGNPSSADEMPLLTRAGMDYGDSLFDGLVAILAQ